MPTYEFECDKCKRKFEARLPMSEIEKYAKAKHTDFTEGHEGLKEPCDGNVSQIISAPNFIIKGGTPKYHTKGGKARQKVDDAIKELGITDESGGYTNKDDE
jgi:putative FmdB family regulatory protein